MPRAVRGLLTLGLVAVMLAMSGCAPGMTSATCKGPVEGSVRFVGSSVPPPYHLEWTLTLSENNAGRIEFTPGYGSELAWHSDFAVFEESVARVCGTLKRASTDDTLPGGSTLRVDLTEGNGRTIRRSIPVAQDEPPVTDVKALVPDPSWAEVAAQYKAWQDQQPR